MPAELGSGSLFHKAGNEESRQAPHAQPPQEAYDGRACTPVQSGKEVLSPRHTMYSEHERIAKQHCIRHPMLDAFTAATLHLGNGRSPGA